MILARKLTSAIRQNRAKFKAYLQYCCGQENLNIRTLGKVVIIKKHVTFEVGGGPQDIVSALFFLIEEYR